MKNTITIAIRVDANPEVGLGHLCRCITLARQLQRDGFSVYILNSTHIRDKLLQGFVNIEINKNKNDNYSLIADSSEDYEIEDAELTLLAIQSLSVKLVIVDSYRLGNKWEEKVAMRGYKLLAIDDFRNRKHYADILVSDIDIPFQEELLSGKPNVYKLVGLKYALIDSEFITAKHRNYYQPTDDKIRVIISYGGSDLTDETTKAILAMKMLLTKCPFWKERISVRVVIASFNPRHEIIKQMVKELSFVEVDNAPDTLANLFANANILLIAGGNSMVEGVFMQKVCLVTSTHDNQILGVRHLHQKSAITYLGHYTEVDCSRICDALVNILDNYNEISYQLRQLNLCDHLGAMRVSNMIKSAVAL